MGGWVVIAMRLEKRMCTSKFDVEYFVHNFTAKRREGNSTDNDKDTTSITELLVFILRFIQ